VNRQQQARDCAALGGRLFAQRRFSEAAAQFHDACLLDPGSADHLHNLAACKLELGQYDEALGLADRAIALDPAHGFAYVNRADANRSMNRIAESVPDYERALRLDPRNPVILNKAGACLRLLEKLDAAEAHFRKALEIFPGFSLARLNLGLLDIARARSEAGARQVRNALRDPGIDPDSRRTATVALEVVAEHGRLQPVLDEALEAGNPEVLGGALRRAPALLSEPDVQAIDRFERLAAACSELEPVPPQCIYPCDVGRLAFLEAWSNTDGRMDPETVAAALAALEDGQSNRGARDLRTLYEVIQMRRRTPLTDQVDEHGESWLRYWHARLLAGERTAFPGQFKFIPNLSAGRNPTVLPEHVQGTLSIIFAKLRPRVPAGIGRALFMIAALINLHAFKDGNGRLARFIYNWEMENAGMHATIRSASYRDLPAMMDLALSRQDVKPACETLLRMHEETREALASLNAFINRGGFPGLAG